MDLGLLTEILDDLAASRARGYEGFDHRRLDRFVAEAGEDGLADRLYDAIPPDRPWEDVADLFATLAWQTSDNGAAIVRASERWLCEATDARRVRVALNQDCYPFLDRGEMERVLSEVARRVPETASLCWSMIESRRGLNEQPREPMP